MKQQPTQQFVSECERAKIFVENEMPIGIFHDFLMELKGMMVDRMVAAHKEQQELADVAQEKPSESSACEEQCSQKEE